MDGSVIRANLVAAAARRGESLAGLSRLLGKNDAYLQQFVTRGSPRLLGERERKTLAAYLAIDEADLGGPLAGPAPTAFFYVPRIDAVASAGPGGLLAEDRAHSGEAIDPALLRRLGVRAEALSIITAQGDSMMPTIADGDDLLVDRSDTRVSTPGGVYVARLDAGLVVKRLMVRADGIHVLSDNPAYAAIIIGPVSPSFSIIGRVVRIMRVLA